MEAEISNLLKKYIVTPDDFELGKKIGEGGFGTVYLATHRRTGLKCAIKKSIGELDDIAIKDFQREISILCQCNNMFLLPFCGHTDTAPLLIVTEFIPGGSLYSRIRSKKKCSPLTATDKTVIALGVAIGMDFLHKKNIIHRDLKSLNVLLDERKLPKICDFGISKIKQENQQFMTQDIGTPQWMAPELYVTCDYTTKVDVYSYAILLWELFTGHTAFRDLPMLDILNKISAGERPPLDGFPDYLRDLVTSCWQQEPEARPTFAQIIDALLKKPDLFPGTDSKYVLQIWEEYQQDVVRREQNGSLPPFYDPSSDISYWIDQKRREINEQTIDQFVSADNQELLSMFSTDNAAHCIAFLIELEKTYPQKLDPILPLLPYTNDEETAAASFSLVYNCVKTHPFCLSKELWINMRPAIQCKPITYLKIHHLILTALHNKKDVDNLILWTSVNELSRSHCYEKLWEAGMELQWLQMVNFAFSVKAIVRNRLDDYMKGISTLVCRTRSLPVVACCVRLMTTHSRFFLTADQIKQNLTTTIRKEILLYLAKLASVSPGECPINQDIVSLLMPLAKTEEIALLLLAYSVQVKPLAEQIFYSFDVLSDLRLVLALCFSGTSAVRISQIPRFPDFLENLVKQKQFKEARLIVSRVPFTFDLAERLGRTEFFNAFSRDGPTEEFGITMTVMSQIVGIDQLESVSKYFSF